ncbi:hypothetical protein [Candidatus Palauibacter sp.]|uniref:hypothetical protein n=1 Tax=Candidatus Palauibacter sp. TaxID=3101350 RepID=UPI003B01415E
MTDVEQFDSRSLSGQALERQLQLGETLELDLESQTLFHAGVPLSIRSGLGSCANFAQLPSERRSVGAPIAFGNVRAIPTPLTWIPVRFGLCYALEKEVRILSTVSVCHEEIVRSLRA